ncbi:hypothetical protein [Actinacidiphila oryziradicis]|jgi:hypothetical protein|uniref:hypothetical protein n=1 Tax=Actinacidiphila oryziradicis TaxID=2571141 RepID=UPI0023F2DB2F|nr:hypothetical protein [Actinacidiphila oryziradicis]MCW2871291.1 hypothetical protein [Actinacidiphila oryziradicis]
MRLGLEIVGTAWATVVLADAALIRTHVLKETYTGIATGAGFIAGALAFLIWFGDAGTPHVSTVEGRRLLSARTLTGVRTIELDALAGVRRFAVMGRYGGTIDELRLRDRHGLRLTIGHDTRAEGFIRRAVERADAQPGGASVKVTRHARSRLGLEPRSSVPRLIHLFFGVWVMGAGLLLPALSSYTVACFLAGTSAWASTPSH